MKGTQVRRVFALFMIVMVLSWTTLPAIAMATWLKAGSPITGTKPITHGGPLKAGAFIAPGEVITGGSAIKVLFRIFQARPLSRFTQKIADYF